MHGLNEAEWSAVVLSLQVAFCAVVLCLIPGILLGWLLARKNFFGKSVLDAVIHLPLVLPPVVVGYLLLLTLGRNTLPGGWLADTFDLKFAFTWQGAALASAVMGFPLMVRSIRLSIASVDTRLEQAARTLGASRLRAVLTVTLPIALPGVISGMILCFARSLGEFGATITFAGNIPGQTRTLPLAIFKYSQMADGDVMALRLVVVSIALSFFALLGSEWLYRRASQQETAQ